MRSKKLRIEKCPVSKSVLCATPLKTSPQAAVRGWMAAFPHMQGQRSDNVPAIIQADVERHPNSNPRH